MSPPAESSPSTTSGAPEALDVILRDGTTLRLRPPRVEDEKALLEFLDGLSEQSLYYRFHGFPSLDEKLVDHFVDPDWHEQGHLIGEMEGG